MKKIFTLVLAVILVVGLNVSAFAAVDVQGYEIATYEEVEPILEHAKTLVPANFRNYYISTSWPNTNKIGNYFYFFTFFEVNPVSTSLYKSYRIIYICDSQTYTVNRFMTYSKLNFNTTNGLSYPIYLKSYYCPSTDVNNWQYSQENQNNFRHILLEYTTITLQNTIPFTTTKYDYLVNIKPPPINIDALNTILQQATSIVNNNYTDETWTSLQKSINKAQSVLSAGGYTQIQIDDLVIELQNSISGLLEKPPPINIDEIKEVLQEAKAIVNDDYTFETFTNLQETIGRAESVISNGGYTQIQIDNLVLDIRHSISALKTNPVLPPIPPETDGHKYLVDGIRPVDIMPYKDAVMENFLFARANGIKLFIILFTLMMIPRVLRLIVGVSSEEHFVDYNAPSTKSRHFKPPKPSKPEKKVKSIVNKPLKDNYRNKSL